MKYKHSLVEWNVLIKMFHTIAETAETVAIFDDLSISSSRLKKFFHHLEVAHKKVFVSPDL